MVIVGFVLVLGFGAVITNLVRLQLVNGETLKTDAVDQSLQSTQLTPSRGTIYDATGTKVLAQSASVWTVALEPNYIDEGDDVKIAKGLSEILGLDYDAVLKKAQQNSYFVYVKRKVETEVRDEIVQYIKDEKIGRGITLMEDYKRYYPYGTTASTVLGFTGTDNQGLAGVETEYDSELSGTAGRLVSAKNAQGDDMPFQYDQYVQAQDGYDLVLTIDETAQSIVEKHLQAGLEACGALEGGTAVLMNVKTGAILALSTKGDYDPNDPFTISQEAEDAIPEKVEDALQKAQEKEQQELNTLQLAIDNAETDEARAEAKKALADYERIDVTALRDELTDQMWAEAQNKQWRNKAVSDTYYPGSVFKMVTGSMAMESGVASEDSTYTCTGQWVFDDPTIDPISCWYHAGHGTETLVDGICNSCNPYMIWLGQKMGRHTFFNFFEAFGFTQRTGIDLPGEADSLYFSEDELNIVELATSSFGQNFSITPIQMITAIAAVANGGYLVQPHVVDRMLDSDGNIVKTTDTSYKRQVISEDVSKRMTAILQKNATSESGKNGYVAGYRVAGKTGTTDDSVDQWFVGVTPYYVGVCWLGYDSRYKTDEAGNIQYNKYGVAIPNSIRYSSYPPPKIWRAIMSQVHEGASGQSFETSNNVTSYQYCKLTGMLAGPGCSDTATGWYKNSNIPQVCSYHNYGSSYGVPLVGMTAAECGVEYADWYLNVAWSLIQQYKAQGQRLSVKDAIEMAKNGTVAYNEPAYGPFESIFAGMP